MAMLEKMIDASSFEVLQPATMWCSWDDSFQNHVLSILHNLKEDLQNMIDHVTKLEDHWAQSALLDETQSVNSKMSKPQEDGEPTVHSTPWADVDPSEKPDLSLIQEEPMHIPESRQYNCPQLLYQQTGRHSLT